MFGNYNYYPAQGQLEQFKQPYVQQYQPMQPIRPNNDERIWVNGLAQAEDYLIAPNSFVRLWDSTEQVFYEKRADASGRPTLDTYEYKCRKATEPFKAESGADIYKEQLNAIETRLDKLERKLNHESNTDDE